jgi:hypothetical protein
MKKPLYRNQKSGTAEKFCRDFNFDDKLTREQLLLQKV